MGWARECLLPSLHIIDLTVSVFCLTNSHHRLSRGLMAHILLISWPPPRYTETGCEGGTVQRLKMRRLEKIDVPCYLCSPVYC